MKNLFVFEFCLLTNDVLGWLTEEKVSEIMAEVQNL